jgi:hypothetical protein
MLTVFGTVYGVLGKGHLWPYVFETLLLVSTGEGRNYIERFSGNRAYRNLTVTMKRFVGYTWKSRLVALCKPSIFYGSIWRKIVIVRQLSVKVSNLEFEENLSNCIGADIASDRHEFHTTRSVS